MAHEVAVLIPNWNGRAVIERCLRALLAQAEEVDLEVVIVDNASNDGAPELLRQEAASSSRIRVVFNDHNRLFAAACNQAYALTDAPFVLVANNDVEPHPGAVAALLRYALATPAVAAVTPRLVLPDGRLQEAYRRLPTAALVIAHYHRLGRLIDRFVLGRRLQDRYFCRDLPFEGPTEVEQPGASFTLLRRSAVEEVGGLFDERFPLLFNDVDLAFRLRAGGWSSIVLPQIRVLHHDGVASRQLAPSEYARWLLDGLFEYFAKHRPRQLPLIALAWPRWWLRWRARSPMGVPQR